MASPSRGSTAADLLSFFYFGWVTMSSISLGNSVRLLGRGHLGAGRGLSSRYAFMPHFIGVVNAVLVD